MGAVDWQEFTAKNQRRIDKIKSVDSKIEEIKQIQDEKEDKPKGDKEELKLSFQDMVPPQKNDSPPKKEDV